MSNPNGDGDSSDGIFDLSKMPGWSRPDTTEKEPEDSQPEPVEETHEEDSLLLSSQPESESEPEPINPLKKMEEIIDRKANEEMDTFWTDHFLRGHHIPVFRFTYPDNRINSIEEGVEMEKKLDKIIDINKNIKNTQLSHNEKEADNHVQAIINFLEKNKEKDFYSGLLDRFSDIVSSAGLREVSLRLTLGDLKSEEDDLPAEAWAFLYGCAQDDGGDDVLMASKKKMNEVFNQKKRDQYRVQYNKLKSEYPEIYGNTPLKTEKRIKPEMTPFLKRMDVFQLFNLSNSFEKNNEQGIKEAIKYLSDLFDFNPDEQVSLEIYERKKEGDCRPAYYSDYKGAVCISSEHIKEDGLEIWDTIAHEMWHAYQHRAAKGSITSINTESYKTAFKKYYSYTDPAIDYEMYYNQLIEQEARFFGKMFMEKMAWAYFLAPTLGIISLAKDSIEKTRAKKGNNNE